jgi:hypothetical protein
LPRKHLDDYGFNDFAAAALREIPKLTSRWTDFNASDPGITLAELLSWLLAAQLFHLDQITDRHRRAFLRLIGFEQKPPEAAVLWACADSDGGEPSAVRLPAFTPLGSREPRGRGSEGCFETGEATSLVVVEVLRVTRNYRNVEGEGVPLDSTGTTAARLFTDDPKPGDSFEVELTCPAAPAGWVSLYLELAGAPAGQLPPGSAIFTSPHFMWEYLADDGVEGAWQPIPDVMLADGTYKLTRTGVLAFEVGESFYLNAGGNPGRIAIRGRLKDDGPPGAGKKVYFERTPRLVRLSPNAIRLYQRRSVVRLIERRGDDGITIKAAVENDYSKFLVQRERAEKGTWVDLEPSQYDATPGVIPGTVAITLTAGPPGAVRLIYARDGRFPADFSFAAPGLPGFSVDLSKELGAPGEGEQLLPGLKLQVAESVADPAAWNDWEEVEDIRLAGKDDRRFSLSADRRRVVFGDGVRGLVPPKAPPGTANVRIINMVTTTGASGRDFLSADIELPNVLTAKSAALYREGRKAEPLEEAIWRAREALPGPSTAVTLADYADFARATPAVEVARAEAVVRAAAGPGGPNRVVLVVIPRSDRRPPEPSEAFCRTVRAYVEDFRTVTTRLEVVGPRYVDILLDVAVGAAPGHNAEDVVAAVRERVRRFFDPLEGGEGGTGWPLGRSLYRSEVVATVRDTSGVGRVVRCAFREKGTDPAARKNDLLKLDWDGLPLVREVSVEVIGGGEVCPR